MVSLQDKLRELRSLRIALNPPATIDDLARLERVLGYSLPTDLRTVYLDHNGQDRYADRDYGDDEEQSELLFRLLSIDELITTYRNMQTGWFVNYPDLPQKFIPCWADDNSNYMLLYTGAYLNQRVVYLDHEWGFNPRPFFTNINSFYASMMNAARYQSYEFETDYPKSAPDALHDDIDHQSFAYCANVYRSAQDEYRRLYFAHLAMYTCPFSETASLYEFLRDTDDRIQGEVCTIFPLRGWHDAIPILGDVIVQRKSLSLIPAIRALGDFEHPLAVQELLRVTARMHPYDLSFIIDQLRRYKFEIREKPCGNDKYTTYEVRQSATDEWQELRGYNLGV